MMMISVEIDDVVPGGDAQFNEDGEM